MNHSTRPRRSVVRRVEIGKELGITRERIRQLETRALDKLRRIALAQ